jgi:hypothetical protein
MKKIELPEKRPETGVVRAPSMGKDGKYRPSFSYVVEEK